MTPRYRIRRVDGWWRLSRTNGGAHTHVCSFRRWKDALDWANRLAIGLRSHP